MSAHTPGPWMVDRDDRVDMEWNNHVIATRQPHFTVCFMSHSGHADNRECEANARLIAAAPDLLEALVQARACLHTALSEPVDAVGREVIARRIATANAAIARAEGGRP